MRTTIVSATALAGGLLLALLMLGPTQAGNVPNLKNALSAAHNSAVTLVRGGGGGGGGAGHGGGFAMGGGHMVGGGFAMAGGHMRGGHEFVGRGFGPRFATHEFHHGFNHDRFHHFHNRRFFVSNVFFFGGYPYYDYGDCYWLKRKAIITGSPYWWARYENCVGYY